MSLDELPESDRAGLAPHPRLTATLIGQDRAQAAFLEAFNTNRLHHGWLLTGPRGIGKATLAWRIARFLLATPIGGADMFGAPAKSESLDIDPQHPVARRLAALSEPRHFLLRRGLNEKGTALSQFIRVNEVRALRNFLQLSAADGGRRVVTIDCADEMNPQAANAILKLLEEPPSNVTFLIIAHQPARLLPTIRSRCRELRLSPLAPHDLAQAVLQAGAHNVDKPDALAALAGGSVGEATRILANDGLSEYERLVALLGPLPRLDRQAAVALAESVAGKSGEARLDLMLGLIELFLSRLALSGARGPSLPEAAPGEAEAFSRLAPDIGAARRWAALQQSLGARARQGRAVNLDPAALVMDMVLEISAAASA
jgi:DNA polymerase-3 subunit delta'